jgi:hypothetical protein
MSKAKKFDALELAVQTREHLRAVLGGRLAYYYQRIPEERDFTRVRMHDHEGGKIITYELGNECLMRVDLSEPYEMKVAPWEPITEAEIVGSIPGPPSGPVFDEMRALVGKASGIILQFPGKPDPAAKNKNAEGAQDQGY